MDANVTNRLTILWRGNLFWASGLWFKGQFLMDEVYNKLGFGVSFVSTKSEQYFIYSGDQNYGGTLFPRIRIDQHGTLQTTIDLNSVKRHVRCSPVFGGELDYGCYLKNSMNCVHKVYGDVDKNGNCPQHRNCWSFDDNFRDTVFPSLGNGFIISETDGRLSSYDCYVECLQNCSCLAYASTRADGSGCEIWNTDPTTTNNGSSFHTPRTVNVRVKGTNLVDICLSAFYKVSL